MDTAWILVAHRSGAKLFENRGRQLNLVQEIPHAEGRLQDKDLGTDKPGRSFDRMGEGRHAMSTDQKPTERETVQFARELAGLLEDGRIHKRYSTLVLVAEPRFLGELRAVLSPQTGALVTATQSKDLASMETNAIQRHLQDIMWPSPTSRGPH
jgi:protein required for attachment to host cells